MLVFLTYSSPSQIEHHKAQADRAAPATTTGNADGLGEDGGGGMGTGVSVPNLIACLVEREFRWGVSDGN